MGKSQSKSVSNSGDPQINIMNTLESHEERHNDHDLKLWILIVMNAIQVAWAIFKWYQKRIKRKAYLEGMKSQDALNKV